MLHLSLGWEDELWPCSNIISNIEFYSAQEIFFSLLSMAMKLAQSICPARKRSCEVVTQLHQAGLSARSADKSLSLEPCQPRAIIQLVHNLASLSYEVIHDDVAGLHQIALLD